MHKIVKFTVVIISQYFTSLSCVTFFQPQRMKLKVWELKFFKLMFKFYVIQTIKMYHLVELLLFCIYSVNAQLHTMWCTSETLAGYMILYLTTFIPNFCFLFTWKVTDSYETCFDSCFPVYRLLNLRVEFSRFYGKVSYWWTFEVSGL